MLPSSRAGCGLLRAEFVLGAQLIERGATLQRGVYHVSHNGSLLAVLDFHEGKCAISPGAHPVDLWEAEWAKRPVGARDMPPGFVPATPRPAGLGLRAPHRSRPAAAALSH